MKILELFRRKPRDTDWDWHEGLDGPVMRRRFKGEIETREMTPEELDDYMESRAGW